MNPCLPSGFRRRLCPGPPTARTTSQTTGPQTSARSTWRGATPAWRWPVRVAAAGLALATWATGAAVPPAVSPDPMAIRAPVSTAVPSAVPTPAPAPTPIPSTISTPPSTPAAAPTLTLSKPQQRLLGITTVLASGAGAEEEGWAEVIAQPALQAWVQAEQAGRLSAPAGGWPLAGQPVQAGQVLARLAPLMSLAERSRRQAQLAALEQRRFIARVNVDRLQLQGQARQAPDDNARLYLQQAQAEAASIDDQIAFLQGSLQAGLDVRAPRAGQLQSVRVGVGAVVESGQPLFELQLPAAPRLLLRRYADPTLPVEARALLPGRISATLRAVGAGPAADGPGWALWLDFVEPPAESLAPGSLLRVRLRPATAAERSAARTRAALVAADASASAAVAAAPAGPPGEVAGAAGRWIPRRCLQGRALQAYVWVHVAPERFERRAVVVDAPSGGDRVRLRSGLQADERVVDDGAALLSQFRYPQQKDT